MLSKAVKCRVRLALAVIMGLALAGSSSIPTQAQGSVIDLELGGEGTVSWNISNIKPGDSGAKTVTLHNAGYRDSFVTMWMSDIISSEGTNPESETGDVIEPGELSNYLLFDLSCPRLDTNLSLPATIGNFPQSASSSDYIRISPLNAGEAVTLDWQWQLPPQTGNDAQGDSLSLTINYLLERFLPEGSGDDGGDGDTTRFLKIDVLGKIAKVKIRLDGTVRKSYVAADVNRSVTLDIDRGTKVTCNGNEVPTKLRVTLAEESPPTPEGMAILTPVYNFTAYVYSTVYRSVEFDPSITLTLSYDPEGLPENTSSVFIAYYDDEQGFVQLEPLAGSGDELGKAKAEVSHLTSLVVMANLALLPPTPEVTPTPPPETVPPPAPAVGPTPAPGLGIGAWIVIGIVVLLLFGLIVWLIMRRRSARNRRLGQP